MLQKWVLPLLAFVLIGCMPELSDVILEVQMLKKYTKEEVFQINYGTDSGFKNSNTTNLPIFNNFEKHRTPVEKGHFNLYGNLYIYLSNRIDVKVTLYRGEVICGQYIFKYSEGKIPQRDNASSRTRQFIVSCPRN